MDQVKKNKLQDLNICPVYVVSCSRCILKCLHQNSAELTSTGCKNVRGWVTLFKDNS